MRPPGRCRVMKAMKWSPPSAGWHPQGHIGTVDKMSRVLEFSESINREKKHIIGSKIEIPQNKISD